MPRLGLTLSPSDLPYAELCALRLDGELSTVDEWFGPIDHPDSAARRAASLAVICEERFIVEQRSAAWVWGVVDNPPQRHELCSSIGARARSSFPRRVHTREVVIDDSEWVVLGGVRVTTPVRTVVDYVRFSHPFDSELALTIMHRAGLSAEECRALVVARRNLPGKRATLARINSIACAQRQQSR